MDMYWICSECGSANKYPDLTECEVCGKGIDSSEIAAAKIKSEQIERQISQEKRINRRIIDYIHPVETAPNKVKNWICSDCGTTNKYPDLTECEVCGKKIDPSEIVAARTKLEQREKRISREKRTEKKVDYIPSVKTVPKKEDKEKPSSKTVKKTLHKKKKRRYSKDTIDRIPSILAGILSFAFVIGIIYVTVLLSQHGKVPGGWILFIINSILSLIVSAVCFLGFHEEMKKEYFFVVPSGIIGAMAISATIVDLWVGMTSSLKEGGLLSIIFSGWLMFIVFILVSVITIVLSIAITQIFPAFLMEKTKQKYIGGFVGLVISIIAGYIYIRYFETDGLNLLLGVSLF